MKDPLPIKVTVFVLWSWTNEYVPAPSWGATGAAQPSADAPCHASTQVWSPIEIWKDPSELNIKSSSKKQALAVTSSAELCHQSPFPFAGPTFNAPATFLTCHFPARGVGWDGFL